MPKFSHSHVSRAARGLSASSRRRMSSRCHCLAARSPSPGRGSAVGGAARLGLHRVTIFSVRKRLKRKLTLALEFS